MEWMRGLLRASPLKLLATLPVLPVALAMLHMRSARRIGASMVLWIVTFGLDRVALERSIDAFAARFEQGMRSLRWFDDGLARLREHIAQGDRVVIVTAAPQWLAERLLRTLASDLQVIGSELQRVGGGWILQRHCRGGEKCRMLFEAGYGEAWRWAYSDSEDDAPILARAQSAFLVNPGTTTQQRVAAYGVSDVAVVRWQ